MADPRKRVVTAETEAAEWHARLGAPTVATNTIRDFAAWRQDPANDEAYRRVERAWGGTGQLAQDPEMRDALDSVLTRTRSRRARPVRQPLVIGLVGVAAAAALAFTGWSWLQARTVFTTAVGEQRLVQLADGSSVRLDTDTRIHVRFDGHQRMVDLEGGQALFTVAHDAGRPFIVAAGEARVTAVGTVFDVRRRDQGTNVTLVSGVVDVASGGRKARMAAGHQARSTAAGPVIRAVDAETETLWTSGRIIFRDTPLRQAVAEVNRYLTDKVHLDAGVALSSEPVSGVFNTGDRDAFVSTASEVFGLQASAEPDGSVRLSERGK